MTMGGSTICSNMSVTLQSVMYGNYQLGPFKAHVVSFLPLNVDLVMGLDVLQYHGFGVYRDETGIVISFGKVNVACPVTERSATIIDDRDFEARFEEGK